VMARRDRDSLTVPLDFWKSTDTLSSDPGRCAPFSSRLCKHGRLFAFQGAIFECQPFRRAFARPYEGVSANDSGESGYVDRGARGVVCDRSPGIFGAQVGAYDRASDDVSGPTLRGLRLLRAA
jgi:hypothetical protein